jgi:urocanate hydratase
MLLDGSVESDKRLALMLRWDVANGVARRCWAGNANARDTIQRAMEWDSQIRVTMPSQMDEMALAKIEFK